jgi:predicted Zn-dependent peptidase
MSYQLETLPNGLRVATERLPGVETVSLAVAVAVGARYEAEAESGLSHLLEHMAYKGTSTLSAQEIAEKFDDMGAAFNAYTSLEHTVYYARVLKEYASDALGLLSDILTDSQMDAVELDRERQVVLQEIAMHEDQPEDVVFDHFHRIAYPDHPLGRSILGPAEQVENYSRDDVLGYMRKHYVGPATAVAVAGAVDHDAIVQQASERFSVLPNAAASDYLRAGTAGGEHHARKDLEQLHVMLGLPAFGFHDDDSHALQLYSIILGGGGSSNLFQEVREKRGLAYSVYAFTTAYADTGLLGVYAGVSKSQAQEVMPVICEQILRTADEATEAQLHRAKQQQRAALFMSRESTTSMAEWIGRHLLDFGRYKTASELAAKVEAVTLDDIRRVSRRILDATNASAPVWVTHGPKAATPDLTQVQAMLRG